MINPTVYSGEQPKPMIESGQQQLLLCVLCYFKVIPYWYPIYCSLTVNEYTLVFSRTQPQDNSMVKVCMRT